MKAHATSAGSPTIADRWDHKTSAVPHSADQWAYSDRGWLWRAGEKTALGFYLDYGPDHYRSPHEYCPPGACRCARSQPGNILAVVTDRPGTLQQSRYCESLKQAITWIEERTRARVAPGALSQTCSVLDRQTPHPRCVAEGPT